MQCVRAGGLVIQRITLAAREYITGQGGQQGSSATWAEQETGKETDTSPGQFFKSGLAGHEAEDGPAFGRLSGGDAPTMPATEVQEANAAGLALLLPASSPFSAC